MIKTFTTLLLLLSLAMTQAQTIPARWDELTAGDWPEALRRAYVVKDLARP